MKLLSSPPSPFSRKVRIVLAEKKIECELETVDVLPTENPAVAHNPLGKIPTLVLADGTILYDSPVVCEYLDTLHAGPKLFPTGAERIIALRRLALGDGMLDIVLALLSEKSRPAETQSQLHMDLYQVSLFRTPVPNCVVRWT